MNPLLFTMKSLRKIPFLLRIPLLKTPLVAQEDRIARLGEYYCYSDLSQEQAEEKLKKALITPPPGCMIARFGRVEAFALARIHFMLEKKSLARKMLDFMLWRNNGFIYETINHLNNMKTNAGFWPVNKKALIRYYYLCLEDMKECDILASWLSEERIFNNYLINATRIPFCLDSFLYSENPWTTALAGKKVLVIHPFSDSIESQYQRRKEIFPQNPNILPEFELQTIKAVQSIADEQPDFPNWFAALDFMKNQINQRDFDIALIGCGAYGFNLAAHVKRMGKKAVHMGSVLQYLFGISCRRLHELAYWPKLRNDAWIRPSAAETPKGAYKVESACYW